MKFEFFIMYLLNLPVVAFQLLIVRDFIKYTICNIIDSSKFNSTMYTINILCIILTISMYVTKYQLKKMKKEK